jgi:hypothetical protein
MGKAEAGSAGEQPARNSPFDWNGHKGWRLITSTFFYAPFQELMPKKNSFFLDPIKKNTLLLTVQMPAIQ